MTAVLEVGTGLGMIALSSPIAALLLGASVTTSLELVMARLGGVALLAPDGSKLVEAVSGQLAGSDGSNESHISRERFTQMQRAALRGTEALAAILDYNEGREVASLDLLITKCYSWGAALLGLSGNGRSALTASPAIERVPLNGNFALSRPVNRVQ